MAEAGGYAPLDTTAVDEGPSPRERTEAARATIAANKSAPAERGSPLRSAAADQTPRLAEEEAGERAPLVEDREAARGLLRAVGLAEAEDKRPAALSGGMRQRAALARTLMEDRPVVLMDEPFSALDAITRLEIQDLAARLLTGHSVLMVTHDPLEALRLGHRILVMSGRPAQLEVLTGVQD